MDVQTCGSYGFAPGSDGFAGCMMTVSQNRDAQQAADRRAWQDRQARDAAARQQQQARDAASSSPPPPPPKMKCTSTSTTTGDTTTTHEECHS